MSQAQQQQMPQSSEGGMQPVFDAIKRSYAHGFHTDIETEVFPKGLSEDVVRAISAKKNEPDWLTDWRVKAYHHWLGMTPPEWAKLKIEPIDFQDLAYFAQPKKNAPKSLDEVDPKLLATFDKLEINGSPRFQLLHDGFIGGFELHGHAGPFQTGHWTVSDADRTRLGIDLLNFAFRLVADFSRRRFIGGRSATLLGLSKATYSRF